MNPNRRLRLFLFGIAAANLCFLGADLDVLLSSPVPAIEYLVIGWLAAAATLTGAIGCAVAAVRFEFTNS